MTEKFKEVIEKNEQILVGLRPNKSKFMFSSFVWTFLCFDLVLLFGAVWLFIEGMVAYGLVTIGLMVVALVCALLWCNSFYSTCFYAVTSKKIIVRSGVFGVDFKTMDLNLVGAVNVEVTIIDKLVGKNTGTIYFLEQGSPNVLYKFSHIENPYEVYRQIKEIVTK